jgi:glutaredoxin-like YruB-family protein
MDGKKEGNSATVVVYSTPACPYCTMAKGYLESRKVKFEDVDVSRNRDRAIEMMKKSGQAGVPVLEINNRIIVGFDRVAIDEALSGAKRVDAAAAKNNILFDFFNR